MSVATIRTSRPDRWLEPRQPCDANIRRQVHGPLRPMDADASSAGFWRRLLRS